MSEEVKQSFQSALDDLVTDYLITDDVTSFDDIINALDMKSSELTDEREVLAEEEQEEE